MKDSGAGMKAIVYGWSQGGGATIAAASLPDYIARQGTASDNIQFLGFVALAPFDTGVLAAGMSPDQSGSEKLIAELTAKFSERG